jgi:hypothetical protein
MNGTGLGSCLMVSFVISGVDRLGSVTIVVVMY